MTSIQSVSLHIHRGTRAVQKMVEYAPSTGGLALWIQHVDVAELPAPESSPAPRPQGWKARWPDDPEPLAAANDGTRIYYAPAFEALSLPRQIGLVAHQVLHVALRHAQRYEALQRLLGDVDHGLYNTCADAIVNSSLSHLGWLELSPRAVLLESLLLTVLRQQRSAGAALLEWDVERLYRAIDDRRGGRGWGDSGGERRERVDNQRSRQRGRARAEDDDSDNAGAGTGIRAAQVRALAEDAPPDLLPAADAGRPEQAAEQAREWRERVTRGHAGDGAHSMLRQLLADLPKVRIPWEHLLRTLLTRGLSRQPGRSWSRPARSYIANQGRARGGQRLPWEPGISSARAVARLVVMVDVSGSIEPDLMGRFAQEIEAISRRTESAVIIVIGDQQVTGVETFEAGRTNLREIRFIGGGGTDFAPLLREADRFRPDIGVFLTDLDGSADFRPNWPVLWAVPGAAAHRQQPFGRKLVLD